MAKNKQKRPAYEDLKKHVHLCARRAALLSIEIMMLLETHNVTEGVVMDRVMSLQGYANYLVKLFKAMLREEAERQLGIEKAA